MPIIFLKVLTKTKKVSITVAGIAIEICIRVIPDTKILVPGPPLVRNNLDFLAFDVWTGEIFAWSLYTEQP
jgi:hypothetical protein